MPSPRKRRKFKAIPPIRLNLAAVIGFVLGLVIGLGLAEYGGTEWYSLPAEKARMNVCFSPNGNCRDLIIEAIDQANDSVYVQSYSFTSKDIAEALIRSKRKGLDVRVLADKGQWKAHHTQLKNLARAGIEVIADPAQGIAHNKVMIIDGKRVITGSYNWSNAAEFRNAENVVLIEDEQVASLFRRQWERRYQQGRKFS